MFYRSQELDTSEVSSGQSQESFQIFLGYVNSSLMMNLQQQIVS